MYRNDITRLLCIWACDVVIHASMHPDIVHLASRVQATNSFSYNAVYGIGSHLDVSLQACISACKDRPACLYVNYMTRTHLCYLLTSSSGVVPSIRSIPGFIFGRKDEWNSADLCTGCTSMVDACVNRTSPTGPCTVQGCLPVKSFTNITVHGNVLTVGSRLALTADSDENVKDTIECVDDGMWRVPTQAPGNCATGWTPISGQCFKHINIPYTWTIASLYCETLGARLAHVNTLSVLSAYASIITCTADTLNCYPWLGINDIEREGALVGVDGQSVSPSVRYSLEWENVESIDCSYLLTGVNKLRMWPCNDVDTFICEMDP